jgi:cytochrome c553
MFNFKSVLRLISLISCLLPTLACALDEQTLDATCVACHGVKGNSTVSLWPKLAGQHQPYLLKQLKAFKAHTRENAAMAPMVAPLDEEDMVALAHYYSQQTTSIGFAKKERLKEGERLYRGGNQERGISACIACHGPRGLGNAQAGFPSLSGQNLDYTIKQLNDYKQGLRRTDDNEIMRDIAKRMTEQDIKDVANYLTGLH